MRNSEEVVDDELPSDVDEVGEDEVLVSQSSHLVQDCALTVTNSIDF